DLAHLEELAAVSNSPILFNAVGTMANMPDAHRFILAWIRNCQERGLPLCAQCVTSGAGFTFTFENGNMRDDSPASREPTLGRRSWWWRPTPCGACPTVAPTRSSSPSAPTPRKA